MALSSDRQESSVWDNRVLPSSPQRVHRVPSLEDQNAVAMASCSAAPSSSSQQLGQSYSNKHPVSYPPVLYNEAYVPVYR